MDSDRLITVAIHTYDRALSLKALLESEGISVSLQNVNLSNPVVSSGIRVRIKESDLPLALRIIENIEVFRGHPDTISTDKKPEIIVPIDFSPHSRQSCDIAFDMASAHKADIILLHSYMTESFNSPLQLSDSFSFDISSSEINETIEKETAMMMDRFAKRLRERMKAGEIPPVKFTTEIKAGLPEDEIAEEASDHNPLLIVMGTRGTESKERDLVGSVTAEVLDTCRFPVFTVPESSHIKSISDIRHVVFFCNMDQEDLLAIDAFYRLFPDSLMHITIANVPSKKTQPTDLTKPLRSLRTYCSAHYPGYTFSTESLTLKNIAEDYARISAERKIDLIAVPNKKRNVFARFFNPSIAHRLLFHADIPMMVIPV